DEVDRFGVEAQQCVQLTNTNRSRAYPKTFEKQTYIVSIRLSLLRTHTSGRQQLKRFQQT
ncbi:hypothetical protein, partial [Paenibacillus sp. LPE1-1-1.1]|uniref:hypothetical protein n=1 Tax=Paenibacillus sp. LPE1-1-1.1 TaxID=3135230 RepID=UPI003436A95E